MRTKEWNGATLRLLGSFDLRRSSARASMTPIAQRVVTFAAVEGGAVSRSHLAGSLWPEVREREALARLRTTLWRVNRAAPGLVRGDAHRLELAEELAVDLDLARDLADRMLSGGDGRETVNVELFTSDLLPDWDDEWLTDHRVAFRLLRIRALEAIAKGCLARGDSRGAERAALLAIRAEPLRETAHMLLANTFVAEGNRAQAVRQLADYQRLLETEIGAFPSDRVRDFVASIRRG